MKGKRVIAAILLVGILAATLAGCKNEDISNKETEKPVITLGSDSYPPYNYLNEDGIPTGIDVELAKEAFQRLGYQPKFENIVWEDKDELLADGTIDCLWSSYSMNGREDKYQWAGPYLYSRQMIVVRNDHDIWTFDDLEGKRIAVQATTKAEDLFLHRIESDLPTVSQVNCFSATEDMFAAIRKNYKSRAGKPTVLTVG